MNLQVPMGKQCEVCQGFYDEIYSMCQCGHKFCLQCCINYIDSKSTSFQQIRCMKDGCGQNLSKNTYVYEKLGQQTKFRIKKYQTLRHLQANPHLKSCAYPQCPGIINTSIQVSRKIWLCDNGEHKHCPKCLKQPHDGGCKNQQDEGMLKLNLRKCPKCSIWVQKIQGCQYIGCKCGITFCYRCGSEFTKDPCRKKQIWKKEAQTRQILKDIKIVKPQNALQYLLFIPKLLLKILFFIFFTIIMCMGPLIILFGIFLPLFAILSPLLLLAGIQQINANSQTLCLSTQCFARILLFILYPLFSCLLTLLALLIIMLYPFCRNANHHGIYDPFDVMIVGAANFYLSTLAFIFQV